MIWVCYIMWVCKFLNGVINKKWFFNNFYMIFFIYKFYENFEGFLFVNLKRVIKNLILYE